MRSLPVSRLVAVVDKVMPPVQSRALLPAGGEHAAARRRRGHHDRDGRVDGRRSTVRSNGSTAAAASSRRGQGSPATAAAAAAAAGCGHELFGRCGEVAIVLFESGQSVFVRKAQLAQPLCERRFCFCLRSGRQPVEGRGRPVRLRRLWLQRQGWLRLRLRLLRWWWQLSRGETPPGECGRRRPLRRGRTSGRCQTATLQGQRQPPRAPPRQGQGTTTTAAIGKAVKALARARPGINRRPERVVGHELLRREGELGDGAGVVLREPLHDGGALEGLRALYEKHRVLHQLERDGAAEVVRLLARRGGIQEAERGRCCWLRLRAVERRVVARQEGGSEGGCGCARRVARVQDRQGSVRCRRCHCC
mmetsp:Transcript_42018/g.103610  ORF Transcript_42018/g.103610 Transcript_42018/m.103610 type:complete len:363 (-) Transcript_42018:2270-3358(-)